MDIDFSGLDLGQFLDQGQSDADALVFAFGGTIRLPEAVEHEGQVFFGDSHAGVGKGQDQFFALFFGAQRDPTAGGSKLERVENEVQQNLFELVAIGENRAQPGVHIGFQLEPLVVGDLACGAGQALDELLDLDRLLFDFHASGLQADEV